MGAAMKANIGQILLLESVNPKTSMADYLADKKYSLVFNGLFSALAFQPAHQYNWAIF